MNFCTFQMIITCITLQFFSSQFKENFRNVEWERSIEAVRKSYLLVYLFYSIHSSLQMVQRGQVPYQSLMLSHSRTGFGIQALNVCTYYSFYSRHLHEYTRVGFLFVCLLYFIKKHNVLRSFCIDVSSYKHAICFRKLNTQTS